MPPEVATAEAPIAPAVEEPTAEPVEEAPPNPAEGEQPAPEGGAAPETEGDQGDEPTAEELAAFRKVLKTKHAEPVIEEVVTERVNERAGQAEAEAAERGLQRTKEADDGESARLALYAAAEKGMYDSAVTLRKLAQTGEVDEDTLTAHMGPVVAGAQALVARDNETVLKAYIEAVLPDMTKAEKESLEPLLYDFRRNGRFDKLPATVAELALGRKDAEIADLKKQLRNQESIKTAAAKLAAAAIAAGPGVGAEAVKGKAAQSGPLTIEEAQTLPLEELIRRSKAQ